MNLEKILCVRPSKTIYIDGDKVIKVFNSNYSKSDVLNEALNLARVEETGLNVPKLDEVTKIDGKWAISYDYIKGKSLAQLIKENPEQTNHYLDIFTDVQLQMHSKQNPLLHKVKDKYRRLINDSDAIATVRYSLYSSLDALPKHVKLLHCNYIPENVIVNTQGVPYIIDWAHATQGDSSTDIAESYIALILANNVQFAEDYLELMCQKSNVTKDSVMAWLPIICTIYMSKCDATKKDILLKYLNIFNK